MCERVFLVKVRARVTRGDFQTNKFEAEKFSASKLRVWRWVMGWEIHDAKPTRDKKMMRKVSFCLSLSLALSFARSLTRSLARLARGLLQRIRNAREPVFQADCRPQVTYIYPLVCCSRAENSRRRDARAVILMPLITVIHLRMGSWGQDIERERETKGIAFSRATAVVVAAAAAPVTRPLICPSVAVRMRNFRSDL